MRQIYNPRLANVSREEFDELMAIVRSGSEQRQPLTDEDRWRQAYQDEQRRKRVVGYQQDLFGRQTVTHYRHNPRRRKSSDRPSRRSRPSWSVSAATHRRPSARRAAIVPPS